MGLFIHKQTHVLCASLCWYYYFPIEFTYLNMVGANSYRVNTSYLVVFSRFSLVNINKHVLIVSDGE